MMSDVDDSELATAELRVRIVTERRRLEALVASLTAAFDDLAEAADASPPDDEHDPEGHTIAFERSQLTGRRDDYLRAISQLAVAEARLSDAGPALCETCCVPIPHERRLAVPTASECVNCAQRARTPRLGGKRRP